MLPGPVELAFILFAFAVGWLVGYIGQTLPAQWRNRFEREQAYFRQYREEADAAHAQNNARIRELETELAKRDKTKARRPVEEPAMSNDAANHSVPAGAEAAGSIAATTEPTLLSLQGLTPELAEKLHELGVHHPRDLAELTDVDEMALETHLGLPAGYITREQWRLQAGLLSPASAPDTVA